MDFHFLGVFIPRPNVSLEVLFSQMYDPGVNLGVTL